MPSTALITLHADQFLYPLYSALFIFLFTKSFQHNLANYALLSGIVLYLATYTSFALLALFPILVLLSLASKNRLHIRSWQYTLVALSSFLATAWIFYFALDYNPIARYFQAIAAHQEWKVETWTIGKGFYFGFLNLLEYGIWCGLPVAILCGSDLSHSISKIRTRRWNTGDKLSFTFLSVLVLLLIFGKTAAEAGRLWMFLLPLVLVCSSRTLIRISGKHLEKATLALVTVQMITILVLKKSQDFF